MSRLLCLRFICTTLVLKFICLHAYFSLVLFGGRGMLLLAILDKTLPKMNDMCALSSIDLKLSERV